ncbi:DNA repair protein rad52, partial [Coemansia aciculifera]
MAKDATQQHNNVNGSGDSGKARSTPYKSREARRIQSQLRRPLGPEHVSTRSGAGNTRLSYIEGWRIISIANQVFGFDGWSSSIQNFVVDFEKESSDGKWSVGGSCLVRITLSNGTYKEDMGYGMIENVKSLGMAYEKVKKEAVTDAIKRAMLQFGNALGNCVYDKEYLRSVGHITKQPRNRLQSEDLFRYSDMVGEASCANLQYTNDDDDNGGSARTSAAAAASLAAASGDQPRIVTHDGKDASRDGHVSDCMDFDMDDLDDDAFDGLGVMESDRPVMPEMPSGNYYSGRGPQSSNNQSVQNTPIRGAATGPEWRPASAPGLTGGARSGASPGGGQGMPASAQ